MLSVQNIRDLCGNNDFKIKCKKGTTPRKIKGINNNKTLERQKKIDTKSFEDN